MWRGRPQACAPRGLVLRVRCHGPMSSGSGSAAWQVRRSKRLNVVSALPTVTSPSSLVVPTSAFDGFNPWGSFEVSTVKPFSAKGEDAEAEAVTGKGWCASVNMYVRKVCVQGQAGV